MKATKRTTPDVLNQRTLVTVVNPEEHRGREFIFYDIDLDVALIDCNELSALGIASVRMSAAGHWNRTTNEIVTDLPWNYTDGRAAPGA